MSSKGKSCLVTGASRGIGRAIARRLTQAGADVLAVARSADALRETVDQCSENSGRCISCVADITDANEFAAAIDRCVGSFGRLDVLVNNAGLAPLSPIEQIDDDTFEQLNAININGVFYGCRAAWSKLKETHGTIVNISSMAGTDPFPGFTAYGATKAWVNLFTKGLAAEGRDFGIKVFAIAPGAVETDMLRKAFPNFPADKCIQPENVADMVEWVLDERCRYMTGQVITVKDQASIR